MDLQDQLNVENKLTKKQMENVVGGISLSSAIIKSFTAAYNTLYGFGQNFGSSIRRISKRKLCSLK